MIYYIRATIKHIVNSLHYMADDREQTIWQVIKLLQKMLNRSKEDNYMYISKQNYTYYVLGEIHQKFLPN